MAFSILIPIVLFVCKIFDHGVRLTIDTVFFFPIFFLIVYSLLYLWAGRLSYKIDSFGITVLKGKNTMKYFEKSDIEGYIIQRGQIRLLLRNKKDHVFYYVPQNCKTYSRLLASLNDKEYSAI